MKGAPQDTDSMAPIHDFERLDRLMTYTTFHIGVYVTLAAGVLAASQLTKPIQHWTWTVSMLLFLLAGACGGAIAGNISELKSWPDLVRPGFRLPVFSIPTFRFHVLATTEHAAFWIGIVIPVGRYVFSSDAWKAC